MPASTHPIFVALTASPGADCHTLAPGRPWRRRGLRGGVALVGLLLLGAAAQAATVVVAVDGIQAGQGRLFVNLCADGLDPQNCGDGQIAAVTGASALLTFRDVAPGLYAAAAFEDLNGNGTLDRSQNGLPLEPYGFSNNAGRRSTPRFEQAAVRITRDITVEVHLSSVIRRR